MTIKVTGAIFQDGQEKQVFDTINTPRDYGPESKAGAFFLDGADATIVLTDLESGMALSKEGKRADSIKVTLDGKSYDNEPQLIGPSQTLRAEVKDKGYIEAIWYEPTLSNMARR